MEGFLYGCILVIGTIATLAYLIQQMAKAGLRKIEKIEAREKEKQMARRNPYIIAHEAHMDNEALYKQYLKWCEQNEAIPMKKQVFLKDVHNKEKYLQDLFR